MRTVDQLRMIQSDVPLVDPMGNPTPGAMALEAIENLLQDSVDANYQGERVLQLLRLEKADNFYRGIQNIAPSMDPASGALVWASYGVAGTPNTGGTSDDFDRAFDYNPRLTAAYGKKFVSVLGQRPFYNTVATAANPKSEADRIGARQVNLLIQMLHDQWSIKRLNHRLAYYLYKTGTVFGHVRPLTDARKLGTFSYQVPGPPQQVQMHPGGYDCPNCGQTTPGPPPDQMQGAMFCQGCQSPVPPGAYQPPVSAMVPGPPQTMMAPRTSVALTLLNGYTLTHPFNVVELEDSPWIINETEKEWGQILNAHPNARQIVGPDGSGLISTGGETSSATAAIVRAAAQSQTGTIRTRNTSLRTYRHTYLHTSVLQEIKDDQKRQIALQMYPNGVRIVAVEGKTVAIGARDFRDELSSCLPSMADYLFADGESWGIFGLEDGMSNVLNIAAEAYETGITKFLVNPDYADVDALNRNRYGVNRFAPAIPRSGESLSDAFAMFPSSGAPTGIDGLAGMYKDLIEGFLGLLPAVYGNIPDVQTLGQARMLLSQGLMQLATTGEMMGGFWEQTDTNAVKMFVKVATSNPEFKGQTINLDAIRNSNWNIKGPSSMPRTYSERKDALQEMIAQSPDTVKALHVTDPVNFPELTDLLDLPELRNVGSEMVMALNDVIDQLWQGQPVPMPQPDGSTQMQPSIQFDPLVFDPAIAVSVAQFALVDSYGQQRQTSPGFANVRAFLDAAHQAMMQQNQPVPQPPRMTITVPADKVPEDQEMAILQKFGIQVAPSQMPSVSTQGKIATQEHAHAAKVEMSQVQHGQKLDQMATDAALNPQVPPPMMPPSDGTMPAPMPSGPVQ